MEEVDPADPESLTLEDLRNLQRSLERRAAKRDAANVLAVGFGPKMTRGEMLPGFAARFLVQQKTDRISARQQIPAVERVRLFDKSSGRFRKLALPTDVIQGKWPRPVGVRLFDGTRQATTAAVLRWTTRTPPPPPPSRADPSDPRWRWGLLTVAHVFAGRWSIGLRRSGLPPVEVGRAQPRVERAVACGNGPAMIEGSLVAAGRLPGGPDAAVVEAGLDRLWLSGLLPKPAAEPLQIAAEGDLLRWIREGVRGYAHGSTTVTSWRFAMYLPEQAIPRLGRLRHVIQFTADDPPIAAPESPAPFGPGNSGSVLVAGGVPLGIQVAGESPGFRTGYAQAFTAIQPWLVRSLGATEVMLVRIV